MRARAVALALLTIIVGWSCSNQPSGSAGLSDVDRSAITQARDATVAALNRGDLDHLYDTFSQDHVTAPPNGPSLRVGEPLRSWHKSLFDQNTVHTTFSPPDLVGAGDVAVDRYDYTMTVTPKAGGTPIADRGKGIWTWRRQGDGSWKLAYAIWNSDLPLQPAK